MRMNPSPAKTTIPDHQFATGFGRAYISRMLTLPLLDMGVTGIFILVTKRFEVVGVAFSGLLLLGLAAYLTAWWLYRPIASYGLTANYRSIAQIDSPPPTECWAGSPGEFRHRGQSPGRACLYGHARSNPGHIYQAPENSPPHSGR